jgi:hypothetical protein
VADPRVPHASEHGGAARGLWWMRKLAGPLVSSGWAGCYAKAKECRPKICAEP